MEKIVVKIVYIDNMQFTHEIIWLLMKIKA